MSTENDIEVQETLNGVCVFDDVIGIGKKFVARVTLDFDYVDDVDIVIYGYGNTEEEATKNVSKRIEEFKNRISQWQS